MSNELALARPGQAGMSIIPNGGEWDTMEKIAKTIVASGLAPAEVNSPQKALVILLKARELGVPPMQALSNIHVVKGKPTLAADLMVGLLRREGHKVWVIETTDECCTMKGHRKGEPEHVVTVSFTKADGMKAGKWGEGTWKQYPAQMLYARCAARICRMVAPDVLAGMYTADEMGASVSYSDDGHEVIEVEPVPPLKLVKEDEPEKKTDRRKVITVESMVAGYAEGLEVVDNAEDLSGLLAGIQANIPKDHPEIPRLKKLYKKAQIRVQELEAAFPGELQPTTVVEQAEPVEAEEESITPDQLEIDCVRCGGLMGLVADSDMYVCYDRNCGHKVAANLAD